MDKPIKVYVVGTSRHYARFIHDAVLVEEMNQADVILFTGGEDVDPNLYGERTHPTTYCSPKRDAYEIEEYVKSLQLPGTLRVGICRGNQLLTILNGGKLVQDVTNHAGRTHTVLTTDGQTLYTSSCHHQMAYPYNLPIDKYEILAVAEPKLSRYYEGGGIHWDDVFEEVEVIYFPETNSLGIQGHPEIMDTNSPFVNYVNSLIISKLNK